MKPDRKAISFSIPSDLTATIHLVSDAFSNCTQTEIIETLIRTGLDAMAAKEKNANRNNFHLHKK